MDKSIVPIMSRTVGARTRVYYVDAHLDRNGQPYIAVSEIPKSGKKLRHRVFIRLEHIDALLAAVQQVSETIKNNDAER